MTESVDITNTPSSSEYPTTSGKPIHVLNADFRNACTPFQVPQLEVIILAVMELFADDPALTLLPLSGRGLGVFKIMPLPLTLEFQVPAVG